MEMGRAALIVAPGAVWPLGDGLRPVPNLNAAGGADAASCVPSTPTGSWRRVVAFWRCYVGHLKGRGDARRSSCETSPRPRSRDPGICASLDFHGSESP